MEEYNVVPSQDPEKYVMIVKLSTELWEHLSTRTIENSTITLGEENKLVIDGKVFTFRTNLESQSQDCFLQDGDTFTEIGAIKRKAFFQSQELTAQDRKRINTSTREAEEARKKHKSVFLDKGTESKGVTPSSSSKGKPSTLSSKLRVNKLRPITGLPKSHISRRPPTATSPTTATTSFQHVLPSQSLSPPPQPRVHPPVNSTIAPPQPPNQLPPQVVNLPSSTPKRPPSHPPKVKSPLHPSTTPTPTNTSAATTTTVTSVATASAVTSTGGHELRPHIIQHLASREKVRELKAKNVNSLQQTSTPTSPPLVPATSTPPPGPVHTSPPVTSPTAPTRQTSPHTPTPPPTATSNPVLATPLPNPTPTPTPTLTSAAIPTPTPAPAVVSDPVILGTKDVANTRATTKKPPRPAKPPIPQHVINSNNHTTNNTNTSTNKTNIPTPAHKNIINNNAPPPVYKPNVNGNSSNNNNHIETSNHNTNKNASPPPTFSVIISTPEDYSRYRTEYATKYDKYKELHERLEENRKLFIQLGDEFKNARTQADKEAASAKIERIYNERHADIKSQEAKHNELHAELKVIKESMRKYLEKNIPNKK